jgi:hypothetical protein
MSEPSQCAPDQLLSLGDPGDETARRFRFQNTYAAIVCCALLDDTQDAVEVFCEHHEDVLLKHADETFTGAQVKTRESDQPPWKTSDEPVLSSFGRFVRLEQLFPGRFRRYRFLTNHPLYAAKNAQSLPFLLEQAASAATVADLASPVLRWVKKVTKDAGASESLTLAVLKKAQADDSLPKLADCTMRLLDTLVGAWAGAAECIYETVRRSARALIDECGRAANLDHEQLLPGYLSIGGDIDGAVQQRIAGKRMTPTRVRQVLEVGKDAKAALAGAADAQVEPGEGSTETLALKLDAGGFSAVSRHSAENLRDKADFLAITWQKKLGKRAGLERYDHIRSVALSDAARAFEATRIEEGSFGRAMREDLRMRFQHRRSQGDQLYDCTDDHLEGFAYTLTSACKVQWSLRLPWEKK